MHLLLLFTLSTFVLSKQGVAQAPQGLSSEAIVAELQKRHPSDTPQWWRAQGPGTASVLLGLYAQTQNVYIQSRILGVLSNFPEQEGVVEFLKKKALTETTLAMKNTALASVVLSLEYKPDSETGAWLKGFSEVEEARTRAVLYESIFRLKNAEAKRVIASWLDQALSSEPLEWVRLKAQGKWTEVRVRNLAEAASNEPRVEDKSQTAIQWQGYWVDFTDPVVGYALVQMQLEQGVYRLQVAPLPPRKNLPAAFMGLSEWSIPESKGIAAFTSLENKGPQWQNYEKKKMGPSAWVWIQGSEAQLLVMRLIKD